MTAFSARFKKFWGNYWVQRGFRVTRVGVLAFTIYTTGYRAGLSDFVADPDQMRMNLLNIVTQQAGATTLLQDSDPIAQRLKRIGPRIVTAAQSYCKDQYEKADEQGDKLEWEEKWRGAMKRMKGEWTFIVLDSPVPNAFVSNMLPQMIFVHKGLFTEIEPTDEELALILAHEVSHLIHDHTQLQSYLNAVLAAVQLCALAFVDPTGTWFYAFDIGAAKLSHYMAAYYSRDTEIEADMTGLQISARACFETRGAGKVFKKFAAFQGHDGTASSWQDTHPSDAKREEYLQEASMLHNPEAYNPYCHKIEGYLDQFRRYMSKNQSEKVQRKADTVSVDLE